MKSTLALALGCLMVGMAGGQRTETKHSIIYRLKSDDWRTCNALHGSTQHDKRGWYCAIEKRHLKCSSSYAMFRVGGDGNKLSHNMIGGENAEAICILENSECWTNLQIDGLHMPDKPCPALPIPKELR